MGNDPKKMGLSALLSGELSARGIGAIFSKGSAVEEPSSGSSLQF